MFTAKADTNAKVSTTADDLREGVHTLNRDARDAASVLKSDMDDLAKTAGKQARKMVSEAEESVMETASTVSDRIRDNPIQSTAIALGIGVILGALIRR